MGGGPAAHGRRTLPPRPAQPPKVDGLPGPGAREGLPEYIDGLKAENAALRRRLESADTHLRLRTAALHRVIARERRQSAIVIGTTAYFPGRVRQIVERYHRWSQG